MYNLSLVTTFVTCPEAPLKFTNQGTQFLYFFIFPNSIPLFLSYQGLLMTCFMMLYNGCSPFLLSFHFKLFLHFFALNYILIFSRSASFSLTQVFNSTHKATSCPFNIFTYILHHYSALCF